MSTARAVSVVGLSFRLPLARDLDALSAVLREGRHAVGPVPADRFRADVDDWDAVRAGERSAASFGAFLDDVDQFDAKRFGVSSFEAARMDPRQRLVFEEVDAALQDAGYTKEALAGSRTGVFLGASNHDYVLSMARDLRDAEIVSVLGNALGMLANRVSHRLDLRGPSLVLDTACSSAHVAMHLARQSLLRGECDLAVCGGINLILSPHLQLAFARARMLSDRGRCAAFCATADGYARGEAVVVLVLARAEDARDGSYADLVGSAVNQDGHTRGIVTPNVDAQVAVMQAALADAEMPPAALSYVETHGTGTRVGDRAEWAALCRVLRDRTGPCAVGSAKANFGHAEPASGAVGLVKVIAAFGDGTIPALLHHERLAEGLDDDGTLVVPAAARAWTEPRVAGVSSFGFGGTNAHLVVRAPRRPRGARSAPRPAAGARYWKPTPSSRRPAPARPPAADADAVLVELRLRVVEALGSEVDPDRSLLELGIDSLELTHLVRGAESRYGIVLPLDVLFRPEVTLRTVAGLVVARASGARRVEPSREPEPPDALLIEELVQRTPGSRALAETTRPVLADNRNSAGFRPHTRAITYPLAADRAEGARIWDVDGHEYVDTCMGFGVHLFGHAPPFVTRAIGDALARGTPLGPQSPHAGPVAALLAELTGHERFAFTSSGTEAVMLACRLARAVTGRDMIAVFEGAYHGTFDGVLGRRDESGTAPVTPGTPASMVADLVVLPWADPAALDALEALGDRVAAVLVEPVQSRRPQVQPAEFLIALRELTQRTGAALVFDEVITGFRCAVGGAQEVFGVRADLAVYGKVVGGGMPIGVVGGDARFLDRVDGGAWRYDGTTGPRTDRVFYAGTFCKHPLAMAAAHAVLRELARDGKRLLAELTERTSALCLRMSARLAEEGLPLQASSFGSLFRLTSVANLDLLHAALLLEGVWVWEGRTMFLSAAHGADDLRRIEDGIVAAARRTLGPRELRLTGAQARFVEDGRLPAWGNLAFAVRVDGAVDAEVVGRALHAVVGRHEVLRTRIDDGTQRFSGPPRVRFEAGGLDERELPARLEALASTGFDPVHGPLLDLRWFTLGPERAILAGASHGAVLDAASIGILLDELVLAYAGAPLPPVASFSGTAAAPSADAVHTWADALQDGVSAGAFARSAASDPAAARLSVDTTPEDRVRIAEGARSTATTLFARLFAAFTEALDPHSEGLPYAVAVPISDRRAPGADRVVGPLTQLMVVPWRPEPGLSRTDRRSRAADLVARAVARVPVPLDMLVAELKNRGLPAELPRVLVNLEPVKQLPTLPGMTLHVHDVPRPAAKFDLAIHTLDDGERLHLDLDYRLCCHGRADVARLAEDVLRAAVEGT